MKTGNDAHRWIQPARFSRAGAGAKRSYDPCNKRFCRESFLVGLLLAGFWLGVGLAKANPEGGTVAQGSASFSSSGSQFTVTTSDRAFINWQSFNIGLGETTTFAQPSAASVVWNRINDPNPSQILGNLNANGYVVLQSPAARPRSRRMV
jgi:TPS secretion domain